MFKANALDTVAKKFQRSEPPPVITALGSSTSSGAEAPLSRVSQTFKLTDSGIHRPKIVSCVGSDGLKRRQLVKGNDDVRQDAVMPGLRRQNNLLERKRRPTVCE